MARSALLEKLSRNTELMPGERLLFQHLIRAQYLVTQGFSIARGWQLTGEQWKKLHATAAQNAPEIARRILTEQGLPKSEGTE